MNGLVKVLGGGLLTVIIVIIFGVVQCQATEDTTEAIRETTSAVKDLGNHPDLMVGDVVKFSGHERYLVAAIEDDTTWLWHIPGEPGQDGLRAVGCREEWVIPLDPSTWDDYKYDPLAGFGVRRCRDQQRAQPLEASEETTPAKSPTEAPPDTPREEPPVEEPPPADSCKDGVQIVVRDDGTKVIRPCD